MKFFLRRSLLIAFVLTAGAVLAQRRWGGGEGAPVGNPRTAREVESHSTGTPMWTNETRFKRDVFTFARLHYSSGGHHGRWGGGPGVWHTDFPDSDLNLSYRLQQMTSMKVDPDARVLYITDKELFDYPWVYIVEPGGLQFTDAEVPILRKYLLNGGFLMIDDFWGDSEWANMENEMRRVFDDRNFEELPLEHELYHCVFEIKEKGQCPNVWLGERSQYDPLHRTAESNHDGDTRTVHHRVIKDDQGRIMVIACHNTDNGDGWEREGEYEYYFKNFSEKIAYPLGVNIIFYAMTH
ncbi:MAG: DUF4159 domain-containing protein [Verrucomicrobia bacterium]|nr:DUF4159 domain-containing protein [Verrucomicrobiota bacterium]